MKPDFIYYLIRWITGFCDIIDGVCVILSFGFYNPLLSFKVVCYSSKRDIKKRMRKK